MKEGAIIHRYGVLALCETGISSPLMTVFFGFAGKSQGYALRCFTATLLWGNAALPHRKEVIYYRVSAFFDIHPAKKQTAVRRCRSRLPKRRKAFQRVRLEDKKLQL